MTDEPISSFTEYSTLLDTDYAGGYRTPGVAGGNARWSWLNIFGYIAALFLSTPKPVRSYMPTATTFSGTTGTLAIADMQRYQRSSNASAQTITVPANASVAIPIDNEVVFFQAGAGQILFAAAGGVTINSAGTALKIASQYGAATLKKYGTDTWDLFGNLSL